MSECPRCHEEIRAYGYTVYGRDWWLITETHKFRLARFMCRCSAWDAKGNLLWTESKNEAHRV